MPGRPRRELCDRRGRTGSRAGGGWGVRSFPRIILQSNYNRSWKGAGERFGVAAGSFPLLDSITLRINNHCILLPNLIIITALSMGAPHATFPMPIETPFILKVIVWLVYPRWKHTRLYFVHKDSRLETGVSPGRLAEEPSRIRFTQYCFVSRYSSVFSPDAIMSYHLPLRTRCNVSACFIVFYFLLFRASGSLKWGRRATWSSCRLLFFT